MALRLFRLFRQDPIAFPWKKSPQFLRCFHLSACKTRIFFSFVIIGMWRVGLLWGIKWGSSLCMVQMSGKTFFRQASGLPETPSQTINTLIWQRKHIFSTKYTDFEPRTHSIKAYFQQFPPPSPPKKPTWAAEVGLYQQWQIEFPSACMVGRYCNSFKK